MTTANTPTSLPHPNHRRRNIWLIVLASVFLLIGLIWLLNWFFYARFFVRTHDAYVHGNQVILTAQVASGVRTIYADDTDLVEEGQLVVDLDPSNFEIKVDELKKKLASTVRKVAEIFLETEAKKAEIEVRKAELYQAELDLNHRRPLVQTGAVSVEQYETYETAVVVARANLVFAEKEWEAMEAYVGNTTVATHPDVEQVVWELRQAFLDLIRCKIYAPAKGYIAKRSVQVGDQVVPTQTLLFIVPLHQIWVEANYKETQVSHIRIGQPVTFTADMYGRSVVYHGTIEGFQPGSGDAFALLPPQNASGNWIKIIQRVPIRVRLELEEILNKPLILGLSLGVRVDVHDTSGKMLAEVPTKKPIYTTFIYEKQWEELESLSKEIHEIITKNIVDTAAKLHE